MKNVLCSSPLKALLFWLFLAGLGFCFFSKNSSLAEKENILTEALLQRMVFEENFGYTLFGNKPVSLIAHFLEPYFNPIFFIKSPTFPIFEAWSILKKNFFVILKEIMYSLNKQIA